MITSILHKQLDNLDPNTKALLESENRNNKIYFDFLVLFLKSLSITNPHEEIYLRLFDFSEEECTYLKSLNKKLTVEHYSSIYKDSGIDQNILERERQLAWADLVIDKARTNEKIIYMDVDILIRGNIQKIYSALDEHDVAVQTWKTCGILCDYDTSTRHESIRDLNGNEINADSIKLCGGVMGFKGSKALQILKELRDLIDSSETGWLTGQLHLYSLYKKYTKNNLISFYDLPQELHDMQLTDASVIWHGNAGDKSRCLDRFRMDFDKRLHVGG